MRLVEKIAELAAQILGLRKKGQLDEAAEVARQAYGDLFGLPEGLIDVVDAATLAGLVGAAPEKLRALAGLIDEEAAVLEARGDASRAARRRALAEGLRARA